MASAATRRRCRRSSSASDTRWTVVQARPLGPTKVVVPFDAFRVLLLGAPVGAANDFGRVMKAVEVPALDDLVATQPGRCDSFLQAILATSLPKAVHASFPS